MKHIAVALLLVVGVTVAYAQDPGATQDAIAERQKILKAADQLDLLTQQNSQITQQNSQLVQQISALQDRMQKLESANSELKSQLAQQQKDWASEREKMLKEVSKIVAAGSASKAPKSNGESTSGTTSTSSTPAKQEQGYEYVVQQGQSLWAIADAYQKNGVNVTVEDIRKANNLGKNEALKVGQKLFIPKK